MKKSLPLLLCLCLLAGCAYDNRPRLLFTEVGDPISWTLQDQRFGERLWISLAADRNINEAADVYRVEVGFGTEIAGAESFQVHVEAPNFLTEYRELFMVGPNQYPMEDFMVFDWLYHSEAPKELPMKFELLLTPQNTDLQEGEIVIIIQQFGGGGNRRWATLYYSGTKDMMGFSARSLEEAQALYDAAK